MKYLHIATLLTATVFSLPATAQRIEWKPVNPGMPDFGSQQQAPTTYWGQGPHTYGSDGSSSYSTGGVRAHSDGTQSRTIGEITYIQKPDGSQFYCQMIAGNAVCKPR